jgi:hypothetical protein
MVGNFFIFVLFIKALQSAVFLQFSRSDGTDAHNKYRARHSSQALQIDININNFAQAYAERMAATDTFAHNPASVYGENLYVMCSFSPALDVRTAVRAATDGWYDEKKFYDFSNPRFDMATGHFTQVVWKSSKKVGFGVAIGKCKMCGSAARCIYVVANYSPAGNVDGQFRNNVTPN